MHLFTPYFETFPIQTQEKLNELYVTLKIAFPNANEVFKYAMPTFCQKKNLIHFAAYKNHIGIYPGPSVISDLANDLSKYKTSKGAIQLPLDKDLPKELIYKIVLKVKEIHQI